MPVVDQFGNLNVLPPWRFDQAWVRSMQYMPLQNYPSFNPPTQITRTVGTIPANRHFVIDNTVFTPTGGLATVFGGYMQISPWGAKDRKTTFALYVDGKLIDSKQASYKVY